MTIATKNSGNGNLNVTFAVCGDLNNWVSGGASGHNVVTGITTILTA